MRRVKRKCCSKCMLAAFFSSSEVSRCRPSLIGHKVGCASKFKSFCSECAIFSTLLAGSIFITKNEAQDIVGMNESRWG